MVDGHDTAEEEGAAARILIFEIASLKNAALFVVQAHNKAVLFTLLQGIKTPSLMCNIFLNVCS